MSRRFARLLCPVLLFSSNVAFAADPGFTIERISLKTAGVLENGTAPEEGAVMTVYHPAKPNGTAVMIYPGGGYTRLVMGPEGSEIAEWLGAHGITGAVVAYRLPNGDSSIPLEDAGRATRIMRSHAKEWKLDPDKIGNIGFSAGGHLASTAATHWSDGNPTAADVIDRQSSRPDFSMLIYPVITMGDQTHSGSKSSLLGPSPSAAEIENFSNEKQVTRRTPPTFLAHAENDTLVPPVNSELYFQALKHHGVHAEYLKLTTGGHGLNGYKGPMWEAWKSAALTWLAKEGFTPGPSGEHYERSARASVIDPKVRAHPEILSLLEKDGKPQDLEHASVDTRVASQGKLVIWLMGYNRELFDRLDRYGMNSIQVCYPREWFGTLYSGPPPQDDLFLSKVRLEAATGENVSPAIDIPKPDSIMERSYQFVRWLDKENPEGNWKQFLTADSTALQWDKVILAGASHGATTAARMAKQVRVDRVVMFCGPRDQYEVWQKLPSATPENRFFGFSHVLDDGWTGDHYPRSWQLMNLQQFGPVTDVDHATPPYGHTRRLTTAAEVHGDHGRAHSSVVPGGAAIKDSAGRYLHEDVWRYLFTTAIEETGAPVPADPQTKMEQRK